AVGPGGGRGLRATLPTRTLPTRTLPIRTLTIRAAPEQIPGVHHALALDLDRTALLEHERIPQPVPHILCDLNPADDVGALHPGRDVDGVPPDVVEELPRPDHAGDHRACGQSDPQRHGAALRIPQPPDRGRHVQCEV